MGKNFLVTVTEVSTYEVYAFDRAAARQRVSLLPDGGIAADPPQLLEKYVSKVDVEEADIVRVKFGPLGDHYAFALPEGVRIETVQLHDEFIAPPNNTFRKTESVVTVVAYGRGDYTGEVQQLTGRVVR